MDKINLTFLKYALKDIDTIDKMDEFCKSRKQICQDNKQEVCKQILKFSGYTNLSKNINFCKIYKQLADFANTLDKSKLSKSSYIRMVPELYQSIIYNASSDLINFLDKNLDKNIYNIKQDYDLIQTVLKSKSINVWDSPVYNSIQNSIQNSPTQLSPR